MWTCDRFLWQTADGRIVEQHDPRAKTLFARPGQVLPQEPIVEKAIRPKEDKAIKPGEDK